jgi:hypothetical protein
MHYIACAFGNLRWTNMHTHWSFQPSSSIFLLVDEIVVPWPKVPRRNLVHHVCCSHVIATRATLGILVGEHSTHRKSIFFALCHFPCCQLTAWVNKSCYKASRASYPMNMCIPHCAQWQVHHMFMYISIMCSSACASHSMHHNMVIEVCITALLHKVSPLHRHSITGLIGASSFNLKLFMWENIFWNCGIYPSL